MTDGIQQRIDKIAEQVNRIESQVDSVDAREAREKMGQAAQFMEIMGMHKDDCAKLARWLLLTRIPTVRSMTLTEISDAVGLDNAFPTKTADLLLQMGFELKIAKYPSLQQLEDEAS